MDSHSPLCRNRLQTHGLTPTQHHPHVHVPHPPHPNPLAHTRFTLSSLRRPLHMALAPPLRHRRLRHRRLLPHARLHPHRLPLRPTLHDTLRTNSGALRLAPHRRTNETTCTPRHAHHPFWHLPIRPLPPTIQPQRRPQTPSQPLPQRHLLRQHGRHLSRRRPCPQQDRPSTLRFLNHLTRPRFPSTHPRRTNPSPSIPHRTLCSHHDSRTHGTSRLHPTPLPVQSSSLSQTPPRTLRHQSHVVRTRLHHLWPIHRRQRLPPRHTIHLHRHRTNPLRPNPHTHHPSSGTPFPPKSTHPRDCWCRHQRRRRQPLFPLISISTTTPLLPISLSQP